jgi:hypothetical protein
VRECDLRARHLTERVDARICTPCTVHSDRRAFEACERILEQPCTESPSACRCQPTRRVPSYASVSLRLRNYSRSDRPASLHGDGLARCRAHSGQASG